MEVLPVFHLTDGSVLLSGSPSFALVSHAMLGQVPFRLVWAMAVLGFGVVLVISILVLLARESGSETRWVAEREQESGRHLQRLSRLLRAIRAINTLVVAERDPKQLLEKACSSLVATRGYRLGWIGLTEEGTKRVRPVTQAGFEQGYLKQIEVTWDDSPTGGGPTGTAMKTGEPSVMRDIETAPEFRPWRAQALKRGYRSSAALPLRFEGRVLGALNVYSEMPDAFDIEEIGLLQEVADHLAYALGSIRLEEQMAQAEHRAQEAERVQSAFMHAPLGMLVTDGEGTVTGINSRMLEFLNGFQTAGQVVGRIKLPKLDVFSGPAGRAALRRVLSEGQATEFECRVVGRDGVRHILSCQGMPVRGEDEGLTETLWFVQDVGD